MFIFMVLFVCSYIFVVNFCFCYWQINLTSLPTYNSNVVFVNVLMQLRILSACLTWCKAIFVITSDAAGVENLKCVLCNKKFKKPSVEKKCLKEISLKSISDVVQSMTCLFIFIWDVKKRYTRCIIENNELRGPVILVAYCQEISRGRISYP